MISSGSVRLEAPNPGATKVGVTISGPRWRLNFLSHSRQSMIADMALETQTAGADSARGWRRSFAAYSDRRVLQTLLLGFSSGLPLLLTYSTPLRLACDRRWRRRAAIGAFALVATPTLSNSQWSPLIDRLPPPLPLGRRRGWGMTIQLALIAAMLCA